MSVLYAQTNFTYVCVNAFAKLIIVSFLQTFFYINDEVGAAIIRTDDEEEANVR